MRRADRLFQIVQFLRAKGTLTAEELARQLGVSPRTIYRDVRDLVRSGIPVEGEAGVGYALPSKFDLPPLMFTEGEISALVLGISMVRAFADPELATRARAVLDKVQAVLPGELRPAIEDLTLFAPPGQRPDQTRHLEALRGAIAQRRKVRLEYVDGRSRTSRRTIRPLGLYFWGTVWTLSAWCELRGEFRNFRPDRIERLEVLDETFPDDPEKSLRLYLERMIGGEDEG